MKLWYTCHLMVGLLHLAQHGMEGTELFFAIADISAYSFIRGSLYMVFDCLLLCYVIIS